MKKAIGILGGMGPEASVYLYKLLIEKAAKEFDAKNNDDFPEIILHSIPVPDFISSDKNKKLALDMLRERVQLLDKMNISCFGIACNTAHLLLDDLQAISSVPFLSMVDAVVKKVSKDGYRTIGILGTPYTLHSKLYQKALQKAGITSIVPKTSKLGKLESVIRHVIENKLLIKDVQMLERLADELQTKGAQGIILGCTELPLVFPKQYPLPMYSSIEILANMLLEKYYGKYNLRLEKAI